jgi:hypothetical protein
VRAQVRVVSFDLLPFPSSAREGRRKERPELDDDRARCYNDSIFGRAASICARLKRRAPPPLGGRLRVVHFGFNDEPRPLHQQRPGLVNGVNLLDTASPLNHTYAHRADTPLCI